MRILSVTPGRLVAEAVAGGILSSRKGVNLPDAILPLGSMTGKDREDCEAALDAGVDWIAVSFVQRAQDILDVKAIVQGRAWVMAKIEMRAAVTAMNEILDEADGIMVARGDLGVELPLEQVPGLQKQLLRAARHRGKPVVVATQMLESMTASPVPTRAEVSDVATAVFEGADAVMLSAESATGAYPAEAVATMDRIAREVEKDRNYESILHFRESSANHYDRGRHQRGGGIHRGDAEPESDRVLHRDGDDRASRRAATAAAANSGADAGQGHLAQAESGLGPALRGDRRPGQYRADGRIAETVAEGRRLR